MELFIDSFGSVLHVKDKIFEVIITENQGKKIFEISPNKIKTILITNGTKISSDAIILAFNNNIDILVLEKNGNPIGRFWHSKLGSTTKIRKCQLEASLNERAVSYVKLWITRKAENQIKFIESLASYRKDRKDFIFEKMQQIKQNVVNISEIKAKNINEIKDTLRGLEGTISRIYFDVLSNIIPKEYYFEGRSNRPAKDFFNAFLNYAYGVLYSKVEKALIIAGIEPYLGFLHRDDYNHLSMVYDFIEQFRIYADEVVFKLFSYKKVNNSHLETLNNGFLLNKEGKKLLMDNFVKFMTEKPIPYNGANHIRDNIIKLEAHKFAQELINHTEDI